MQKLTIKEFHEALKAQGVTSHEHFAFVCPICSTVQSAADLMRATGNPFEVVERSLGFSCIGRFTSAGPFKEGKEGEGCDWTLGGLLSLHKLVVVDDDGKEYPRFELANAEQAQQHEQANRQRAAA
ncbi:VVA0879 family protein [Devosia sp. Naph2]|uniref:VVA0879 family protein n=1 Tax=Devosia polycyclovorans TaxID=3345148 RepID=UPI0035D0D22A